MKNWKTSLAGVALAALLVHSASAAVTIFTFASGMVGANEVPSVSSPGFGTINTLSYDDSVGANGTLTVDLSFSNLNGTATAAHIHGYAAAGANAGALQGLTVTTGVTSGSITGSWALPDATAVSNLFGGLTYINLHSSAVGSGEIRGQLTPVPEPASTAAIAGVGALAFLMIRRFRRQS